MMVIILVRPSADLDTMPASSAYSMPACPKLPSVHMLAGPSLPSRVILKVLLAVNQIPHNVWVLTEAYYHGVSQQRRRY